MDWNVDRDFMIQNEIDYIPPPMPFSVWDEMAPDVQKIESSDYDDMIDFQQH